MLIEPRPAALLNRVCDALEASPGDARQQRAALWLLRDLASSIDGRDAAIAADIVDMRALLADLSLPPQSPPAQDAAGLHIALQGRLEAMAGDPAQHARRVLQLGILKRERALPDPPGGNPSLERPAPAPL